MPIIAPAPKCVAGKPPGTKPAMVSSYLGLMPPWEERCTTGDQPPAMPTRVTVDGDGMRAAELHAP